MKTKEELIAEGKAIEIKENFLLFATLSPERQPFESYEEYKFRQKVTKRSVKKFLNKKI